MQIDSHFDFWKMDDKETYENGNGIKVRAWAINQTDDVRDENFCAIQVSDGEKVTEHYFTTEHEMVAAVRAIMWGVIVKEGEVFEEGINQGMRDCDILKVNKKRFRIGYDMPNAGYMEGWRTVTFERNGVKYYIPKK
jgi:hypothetical protein